MEKINITFCSFPDFAGNAKALFNYMKKKYKNSMNYVWVVQEQESVRIIEQMGAKAYLIGSKELDDYISKTDIFFTTHANLIEYKKYAKKSIYVELWHGIGPKPVGYLMKNISEGDKNWLEDVKKNVDYFVVPSEFWRVVWAATFDVNVDRVLNLGLPLFDELLYSDGYSNLSKILGIDLKKYKKIIMYMPTYKTGCGRKLLKDNNKENILNLKRYNETDLLKFLQENNYLLLIKRHPSDEDNYKIVDNDFVKNINNDMLSKYMLNVNNILNACDILITDYSSVGTEYSFLQRPVIYLSTDLFEYKDVRGIIFDDYNFWTENNVCDNYNDFVKLVNKYIGKKSVSKYKILKYGNFKDGGCDKLCETFFCDNRIRECFRTAKKVQQNLEQQNINLFNESMEKDKVINELRVKEQELESIKKSRSWKIMEFIRKFRFKNK